MLPTSQQRIGIHSKLLAQRVQNEEVGDTLEGADVQNVEIVDDADREQNGRNERGDVDARDGQEYLHGFHVLRLVRVLWRGRSAI